MKLAPDWRRGKIYGTNETKGPCSRLVDGATVYTGTNMPACVSLTYPHTICPRSLEPIHIVAYYIKWGMNSLTYLIVDF